MEIQIVFRIDQKAIFLKVGTLKSPEETMRIRENKSNWICEYRIVRAIFKQYELY